jgi:hypothetical protein
MAISPISVGAPGGAAAVPKAAEFGKLLKPTAAPTPQAHPPTPAPNHAHAGVTHVGAGPPKTATPTKLIDDVSRAQSRMDQVLKLAESGRSFSPAELLSLQAQTYRASQEIDLAGKVVEKATGGLKQVLQTQV